MKYNARINFADSFDVYTELNETEPFITDVKLKDSTSLDRNITLGTSVCKQLSFTLHNAPINVLDGQKVTLYIKEQPDDIEAYDMTADGYDDDTIGEAFEVEEVPEEEGNISAEALAMIEADEDVSEEIYEIPIEDSEDITPVEGVDPENNVYREDEDITPVTDEDYGEVETDNYIMMGEFYITDVKESNNTYYLTALDGFILMNSPYVPTNTTDTVENMHNDFRSQLSQMGIVVNEEPEYPSMTITWNFPSTFREAAGFFAGLMGGYATFDRNGALDIRQYMKVEDVYVDYSGIEWSSDNSITIIGMRCDTDITATTNYLTVRSEDLEGMMIEFTNPLMTQSVLENIYTTYYEYLEYTPCKVTLDWYDAIRAGDLINIDDNWILITNQTIDFGAGSSTIDSLGTTITRSEGQIENPVVRQVQRVQTKLSSNIQVATELANEASAIAEATGQHFWSQEESTYVMTHDEEVISWKTYYEYDSTTETYTKVTPEGSEIPVELMWYEVLGAGVYVTEADQESFKLTQGGMNSLWNSLGMLFRKGLTNLLSILSGGSEGTGARGIAIYDGEGNNPKNVVASFTNNGAVVGKTEEGHIEISDNTLVMKDSKGGDSFKVTQDEDSASSETYTENVDPIESGAMNIGGDPEELKGQGVTQTLTNEYVSGISIGFKLKVYHGVRSGYTINYTLLSTETVSLTVGSTFSHDFYVNGDTSSDYLWTYEGSTSFDSTNFIASLNITDYVLNSGQMNWTMLWYTQGWTHIKIELEPIISYQTTLLMPIVTIGRYADVTSFPDTVFAIGKANQTTSGTNNVFRVARDGGTNIQGGVNAYGYKVLGHNSDIGTVEDDWLGNSITNRTLATSTWKAISTLSLPAGVWLVIGIFRFPASNAGIRRANIGTTNGGNSNNWNANHISASEVVNGQIVKVFQPTDWTDYYLNVWQNSGSSMTLPEGDAQSINSLRAIRLL